MEITAADVKVQIQKDMEQSREQNKAMLEEARLRFYKRIFEERSYMEARERAWRKKFVPKFGTLKTEYVILIIGRCYRHSVIKTAVDGQLRHWLRRWGVRSVIQKNGVIDGKILLLE